MRWGYVLSDFSNEELVVLASTLAISIFKEFNKDDLAVLATFYGKRQLF